jgi:uncharacterized protein YrrD
MIKAHDLDGRAVVDLESAKKVGYVDEIYLDTDGERIAAYLVAEGSKLTGGGQKILMPASAVETIGPEAIMVRSIGGEGAQHGDLDRLPRLSQIKGRKVVSEGGKLLGTIDDVLLDDADGHIHGYTLKNASWTDTLLGNTDDHPDYVRGDAHLRLGEDLLVVPENAVVFGKDRAEDMTDDEVARHDRTSAIDSLSSDRRATRRTHMNEAQPPRVEYAEPIGHADTTHADTTLAEPTTRPVGRVEHWDDVRSRYRTHWEQRTAGRGGLWEEHEPGYRYGWEMANRQDFRGKTWDTAEPELRRDWETRHHDRPWDRVADAIRDTWDDVTGRDETDVAGYRSTRHHDDAPDAIDRLSESPVPAGRRVVDEGPDSRRSRL